ncbi:MAG TPA: PspC domain-containing protein [Sphingobacteriaceae bacterium]|nr:PspC domain-containing protein [Sphingobacteriaceae bacterium]
MEKRLYRNETEKILAGVSSGLAEYFDMEVTWVRIIFVAIFGFSGVIIYIILWIVIPAKPFNVAGFSSYNTDYRVYEDKSYDPQKAAFNQYTTPPPPYLSKKNNNGNTRLIGGMILVFFGTYCLLDEFNFFPYWLEIHKLWPLLFIILGVLIISKAGKKKSYSIDKISDDQSREYRDPDPQTSPDKPINDTL